MLAENPKIQKLEKIRRKVDSRKLENYTAIAYVQTARTNQKLTAFLFMSDGQENLQPENRCCGNLPEW